MTIRAACRGGAAVLWLTLLGASAAAAQQTIEGRVLNSADGQPVEDVSVRVVGEDLQVGTDSAGVFRFELPLDRPGFALEIEVIGFKAINKTWMLPLERPLVIALERDAVELEGIEVAVDRPSGWTARPLEYKLKFRVRTLMGIDRTATLEDLRAFEHQEAEIWDFLPQMNVAQLGYGGFIASGRVPSPSFVIDDRGVVFDEFRTLPVEDVCRLDLVTFPRPGLTKSGLVIAYTCDYLMDVVLGKERLTPFLPIGPPGGR